MENPSFIAISHLAGLRRQLDVIANNVANAATAGYQGERMSFETMVSRKARSPGVGGAGQAASFVVDKGLWRDYRPGPVERTGNTFDVALIGPGYIAVQTEEGERYTRAGAFRTDAQGRLALGNGALLLNEGGQPITVPQGETQFEIDRRGVITGKDGVVGRIRVVRFDDEQALRRAGNMLLETEAEPRPVDRRTEVAQGMIEKSNVQSVSEITQMIELTRRYQSASRMIDQEHERARRAIDKLSRVG